MTLPERLRQLREEHNVSQTKLARTLRITRQAYNHYEMGRREPSNSTIKELARYYGVSTDYILGASDDPDMRNTEELKDMLEARLLIAYKCLSESNKMNLSIYAEFLVWYEQREIQSDKLINDFYGGKISSEEFDEIKKILNKDK